MSYFCSIVKIEDGKVSTVYVQKAVAGMVFLTYGLWCGLNVSNSTFGGELF